MVREAEVQGSRLFFCGVCDFGYEDRLWAERCEAFCTEHNACSIEITSHAVVRGS